ncbi:MAG: di-trans,poly-cis-decaprenylcistransferase [Clostridia bacterium]|nr:di-trans,poly-cis-decaprenylcistransferase [Clostridia bacterium]
MDKPKLSPPIHVGVIMDGNGRWAEKHGRNRSYGHKAGANLIEKVSKIMFASGVEYLSLYAFSTENFARPKEEVDYLMNLLKTGIKKYGKACFDNKIKLTVSGDLNALSEELQSVISTYVKKTEIFEKPVMNICLNYGARQELCHAFNHIIESGISSVTPQDIDNALYTKLPPLDLIIRTGGEKRLSNFMLWQAVYAELYFTDVLWPDFTEEECLNALEWFSSRKRRFGKI